MKVIKPRLNHDCEVNTAYQPKTILNILELICNNLYLKHMGLYQINCLELYKQNILS